MSLVGAKCAVLGAGGFIGTNLCLELARLGATITAVGRRSTTWPVALSTVRWVEAEFTDATRIAEAVAGQEFVFHLIGGSVPVSSNEDPVAEIEAGLIPSLRLIKACSAAQVGRLVYVSSGGTVYGPSAPTRLDETSPTNPITAYGVNKLAIEKYVGLSRHLYGLDAIILRLSNPYGPYQHGRRSQGIVHAALNRALRGQLIEIWGDGSIVRDYVYVDDVVQAIIAAVSYREDRWLFNIGSGQGRSIRQVVEDICALTSTPLSNVVHRDGRAADVPYNVLDCTLANEELKWWPRTSWRDGLERSASWLSRDDDNAVGTDRN